MLRHCGGVLTGWFWHLVLSVSIRVKLIGIILVLVLALGHAITVQARNVVERTLESHLEVESSSIALNVAARATDMILINDLMTLKDLLQDIRLSYDNIRYIFVLDPYGFVLAHTFGEGFPTPLIKANSPFANNTPKTSEIHTTEGSVWDTAVIILWVLWPA